MSGYAVRSLDVPGLGLVPIAIVALERQGKIACTPIVRCGSIQAQIVANCRGFILVLLEEQINERSCRDCISNRGESGGSTTKIAIDAEGVPNRAGRCRGCRKGQQWKHQTKSNDQHDGCRCGYWSFLGFANRADFFDAAGWRRAWCGFRYPQRISDGYRHRRQVDEGDCCCHPTWNRGAIRTGAQSYRGQ